MSTQITDEMVKAFISDMNIEPFKTSWLDEWERFKSSHSSLGKEGERDWEIVRVRNKYHATDVTHDLEEYNGRKIINGQNYEFVLNSMNHKYHIEAVKRLSDGEVFSIGDGIEVFHEGQHKLTGIKRIDGFRLKAGIIVCHSAGDSRLSEIQKAPKKEEPEAIKPPLGIIPEWLWKEQRMNELEKAIFRYDFAGKPRQKEWVDEYSEIREWLHNWHNNRPTPKKEALFTTEDGVIAHENDTVYHLCILRDGAWKVSKSRARKEILPIPSWFKYFSTEEAAKEYVLMNKPCLSIQNVLDWNLNDESPKELIELVQSKLKGAQ
jgi:hypothetical protein